MKMIKIEFIKNDITILHDCHSGNPPIFKQYEKPSFGKKFEMNLIKYYLYVSLLHQNENIPIEIVHLCLI